jgi:hypothetical protein
MVAVGVGVVQHWKLVEIIVTVATLLLCRRAVKYALPPPGINTGREDKAKSQNG